MTWRLIVLRLAIILLAHPLFAHTISLTYAEVSVGERQVVWNLKLPVPELDLLLGLDENHDGRVDSAEINRSQARIQQYVLSKLAVRSDGREVPGAIGNLRLWKDPDGHPFVLAEAVFSAGGKGFGKITLHCDMLRDVVATHQTIAKITSGGETVDLVFENGRDFEVDANPSTFRTVLQFVHMGIIHISAATTILRFCSAWYSSAVRSRRSSKW